MKKFHLKAHFLSICFLMLIAENPGFASDFTTITAPISKEQLMSHIGHPVQIKGTFYKNAYSAPAVLITRHHFLMLSGGIAQQNSSYPNLPREATIKGTLYYYEEGNAGPSNYSTHGDQYFFFDASSCRIEFGDPVKLSNATGSTDPNLSKIYGKWIYDKDYSERINGGLAAVVEKAIESAEAKAKEHEELEAFFDDLLEGFSERFNEAFENRILEVSENKFRITLNGKDSDIYYQLNRFENGTAHITFDKLGDIIDSQLKVVEGDRLSFEEILEGVNVMLYYKRYRE